MNSRTKYTLHRVEARRLPRPTFQDFFLKFGLVLLIALIFTAADAFSATDASLKNVSSRFDGRYGGAITPATDSDPKRCPAATITDFVVKGGYIQGPAKIADSQSVMFDGFVTAEGFITGHFRLPSGPLNQFEGRMVQETTYVLLSGGLTDSRSGCAYLLELRKQIQPR